MFLIKNIGITLLFFLLSVSFSARIAFAVAPSDDVIVKWKKDGVYEKKMEMLDDFHKRGGCSPVENIIQKNDKHLATGIDVVDTVRVLVLLVDFSDHPADGQALFGTPADFDSILFSEGYHNPTGSMTDYYLENSYGKLFIQGEIFGWYRMPLTYAQYTGGGSGIQMTTPNSQTLVNDAITIANSDVDFSKYDFNNDGVCDGVIVIHSGPGAEGTGSDDDIWSHKWNIPVKRTLDGVDVYNYNINPEEYIKLGGSELSPIGVFCHEYGHFLGLPDLYDTDYYPESSDGLGKWSLMASGNYNGDSKLPAHFDPWCKNQLGFLNLIDVTDNLYNIDIPQVETSPTAFKLHNSFTGPDEYFIVENRQQVGFDKALPGNGLLIYHVDETRKSISQNNDYMHYWVGLEQADGIDQLAFAVNNRGDNGDSFPGFTNKREFNKFSIPNSDLYDGEPSQVSVWNISNSDSIMNADLDIAYSRPWIETTGINPFVMADADADGILEAGESVQFFFSINNQMRVSQNVHASLSSRNSGLQFTQNDITITGNFNTSTFENPFTPIEFTVPDTLTPQIDSFFLTITTDSLDDLSQPVTGSDTYSKTFGFEVTLGKPNILIVDADRGASFEEKIEKSLYENRVPSDTWHKNISGTPTINDLLPYDIILWLTGEDVEPGAIDAADIAVMKQFMDNGKNIMLSTVSGVDDIMNIDSTLLIDYFHARRDSSYLHFEFTGVPGNPIGDNLKFRPLAANYYPITTLIPSGSGMPAFSVGFVQSNSEICGVTYEGSYKSALITFAVDLLDDTKTTHNRTADLISKVIDFFGGVSTAIYDGNPFEHLPNSFELAQNYPNPFNPTTTISYTIRPTDEKGAVTKLEVFNIMGQKVTTLVDEAQIPGRYEVQWDGTNASNQQVSSGIYFYRLIRGSEGNTKKMTLLK